MEMEADAVGLSHISYIPFIRFVKKAIVRKFPYFFLHFISVSEKERGQRENAKFKKDNDNVR